LPDFQIQINAGPMQPANLPFIFTASDKLDVRMKPVGAPDWQAVPLSISLSPGSGAPVLLHDFTTSPIAQFGLPAVIHGPFGGDCTQTSIHIGGRTAPLIAESQHALFYWLPEITPGPALIELQDGKQRSRLKTWALGLQMSADRLKLMKGESTAFHVVVLGAETIPEEAWSGGGVVPELEDLDSIHRFLPDFRPPGPSSPGVLLLTIENKSPSIVTMGQGERVALTFTRPSSSGGKMEYHGRLVSKQAGAFNVGAVLIPFLHEQRGESVGQSDNTQVAGNTPPPVISRGNEPGSSSGKSTTPDRSTPPER